MPSGVLKNTLRLLNRVFAPSSGRRAPDAFLLEDRLLFSATPVGPAAAGGANPDGAEFVEPPQNVDAQQVALFDQAALVNEDNEAALGEFRFAEAAADRPVDTSAPTAEAKRLEAVFVDPGVEDYQRITDELAATAESSRDLRVFVLDSQRDGVEQISEILAGLNEVSAVHLVASAADGAVKLGSTTLSLDNVGGYAGDLVGWRDALTSDATVLFYDGHMADNADGQTLLESLHTLTGAEVSVQTAAVAAASAPLQDSVQEPLQALMETPVTSDATTSPNLDAAAQTTDAAQPPGANAPLVAETQPAVQQTEIAFVDTQVADYQQLVADLQNQASSGRRIEVVLLDGNKDGIDQITAALNGRQGISAIHVFSHGVDGSLELGNAWLNSYSLESRAAEIAQWRASLSAGADILLYGCDLAADAQGQAFVNRMGQLTGADVAASQDATGNAALGGNWNLEYRTGAIEANIAISTQEQQKWDDVLAITAGNTSSSMTTGATSLTWAHTVAGGSNGILVVNVSFQAGSSNTVSSVTYGGTALTLLGSAENATGAHTRTEMWYLKAPAAGTANVVISMNASIAFTGGATNFFGVDQTTPTGTFVGVTANNRTPSVTVASASGDLVIDSLAQRATSSGTVGVGQTEKYHELTGTAGGDTWGASSTESGAASVTMDWSTTGSGTGEWAMGAVSLKPAATNNAPTISGLAGDSLYYTAGGGAIVIEQGSNVSITDIDSADFATGTLTVSFAAGSDAVEDVLAIRNQGTGAGQIGVSGANVTYGGTIIGSFTGGSAGSNLVVTLNASANPTSTAALIQNITFQDTDSASPTTGTRAVRFVLTDGEGGTSANVDTSVTLLPASTSNSLWLSSLNSATTSAGSGSVTYNDGQVVRFADPNLALGSGTTAGTFSQVFDIDTFATSNADINGLHYVSRTVVVGTTTPTTLQAGDVLLTVDANDTLGGVAVTKNDIVLFRPTTPGNYASGTFSILLKNPTGKQAGDFALVEQTTVIGGTTLQAGSFLIAQPSKSDLDLFVPTGTGAGTTSGTLTAKFIDGAGFNLNPGIEGVELIQGNITIGGASLTAGQLLISLNANDSTVGSNNLAVSTYDIFVLTLTSTGSGTTAGTASQFFVGANVGLTAGGEETDAIALVGMNQAPVLSGTNNLTTILEDPASNPGTLVSALISGKVTDGDSGALTGIAVTGVDNTNGTWQWSANGGVNWNAFGSPSTASARLLIADANTCVRFVPNTDWNGTVSSGITFRAWDRTSGTAGLTADTTTSGGSSAFSSATASVSITVTAVNDAPVATNLSAAETYTEDTALNLIDIVVSDVDGGSVTATLTLSNTAAGTLNTGTSGAVASTYNAGTGVWTASGAIANVNTLLAGLTFTPAANFNSNFTIATSVSDGSLSVTGTKSMTGTAVNDAPTATNLNAAETYTEDTALNLIDIVVSDVDSASVTATLTLSNVSAGSLNTGTSGAVTSTYSAGTGVWTASGAIADVNTLLAGLTFTPAANLSSNFTIATSISDDSLSVSGSKAMTGIAVNNAPTATNLSAAQTYTEDTPLALTAIVASDVDSASVTATLTLSNASAGSLNTGTSGAVTSTYNAGTGVWTASGAIANVNTLLAGLTFTPAANFNSNVTIATSISDGSLSVTGSKAVTGTPVNDAPTLDASRSPVLAAVNQNAGAPSGGVGTLVSSLVDFAAPAGQMDNATDPDSSAQLGIAVTGVDATNGTWWYSTDNGSNWLALGTPGSATARLLAADANTRLYFQPNANFAGSVAGSITFRAWDQSNGSNGGIANTSGANSGGTTAFSTTTDTASLIVNAQPVSGLWLSNVGSGNAGSITWDSNDVVQLGNPNLTFGSGTSNGTFSATSLNFDNFGAAGVNMNGLHYVSRTVTVGSANAVTLQPGDVLFSMAQSTTLGGVSVSANDIALFHPTTPGNYASGTISIVLQDPLGSATRDFAFVETSTVVGGVTLQAGDFLLTASNAAYSKNVTRYQVTDVGPGTTSGTISTLIDGTSAGIAFAANVYGVELVQSNMTLGGQSFTAGQLLISLSAADTVGTNNLAVTQFDIFSLTVTGTGTGTSSGSAAMVLQGADVSLSTAAQEDLDAITLVATNALPVVTTGGTLAYTENAAATTIDPALTVSDADSANLTGATVTISSNYANGEDVLAFTNQLGITGNWNAGTGVLTLSGTTTVANYRTALRAVTYVNTSDAPSTATRGVSFVVNDGTTLSTAVTRNISVTAVNDAPVLSAGTGFSGITEDDVTNTGNLVSTYGNLSTDVDSGALKGIAVTAVDNTNGTWQYTLDGTNWFAIGNVSTTSARLLPSDAVSRICFVPNANWNGATGMTSFKAWDQTSGTAGGLADVTVNGGTTAFSVGTSGGNIAVSAVNDAPVASGSATLAAINEDTASPAGATVGSLFSGNFSDAADQVTGGSTANTFAGIAISSYTVDAAKGNWQYSINSGGSWTTLASATTTTAITLDSAASTMLRFVPTANYNGAATALSANLIESGQSITNGATIDLTSATGGTTRISAASVALNETINAVNDAPVVNLPAAQSVNEDTNLVFSAANGNQISVSDADAASGSLLLTLSMTNGTLTLNGTTGLTLVSGGSGTSAMQYTGTLANINAALNGMFYTPTANFNGGAGMGITIGDQGNTGSGGALSDSKGLGVTVNAVNAAPVLSGANNFTTITEDQTTNSGDLVSTLIAGQVTDVDTGAVQGIAVTGLVSSTGTWQYSIDNGATWNAVGAVAGNSALLLRSTDKLRFVPDAGNSATASVTFCAWDQTSGSAGSKVDVTTSGGTTAFSTASATSNITVSSLNDAPTFLPSALGSEMRVNTTTTDVQTINANVGRALAGDSSGNFVVAWASNLQDGAAYGIYAQRFNANGTAQGAEFRVNTATSDTQILPSVAMDATGNFVVTWSSNLQDGSGFGLYAQRYNATGVAQGSEFLVNTTTAGSQLGSQIAMAPSGVFVISWSSNSQDPDASSGIYAQRYDASSVAQGGEFRVNTYTTNTQQLSSVSMDGSGNFVVTWASNLQDGSGYGIYGQRYAANGTALGGEFRVNTTTSDSQLYSSVAMLSDGRFAVAYQSRNADGSYELYVQRYAADGTTLGGETHVNTSSVTSYQPIPSVAVDVTGNIAVVWNNSADGSGAGAVSRYFNWSGLPLTDEFQINTTTSGDQLYPKITSQGSGGFVVAWGGNGSGDADGVFFQRYGTPFSGNNFTTITEDQTTNAGDLVSTLITGKVSDVDTGSVNGIAVTSLVSSTGTWQYSTDNGTTWANVGTVAGNSALLLRSIDKLCFVPDGLNGTTASVTFCAWDQTSGTQGTKVDTTTNGITTAFSTATATSNIMVTSVNDAPTATNLSAAQSYTEDTPLALTAIVASDVDSASVTATLTLSNASAGSLNTGTSGAVTSTYDAGTGFWTASGAIADVNTLLAGLTFTPAVNFNGSFTIATSISDGSLSVTGTKSMTGIAVNDAPVFDNTGTMTLTTITEDQTSNSGDAVGSIILSAGGNRITDPDSAFAFEGFAVTGLTNGSGMWEYTINGTNWFAVGAVSDSSALLLRDTDRLRFIPDGQNGTTATITFRAWDQTFGTQGTKVNVGTNGGTTAFSTATETAGITVTSVNDAPSLSSSTGFPSINEDDVTNTGSLVSTYANLSSDVDAGASKGIAVTSVDNTNGTWQYTLDGTNWLAIGNVSTSGARLLPSDATSRIRFVPNADWNGVTGLTLYQAWDQTSGTAGGLADVTVSGGTSAFSFGTSGASLAVLAVNDAPVLTSNGGGATAGVSIAENITAVTTVTSTDVDGGTPTYSIVGGADAARFAIVGTTGVLSFASVPDFETPTDAGGNNVYDVIVQVSDGAGGLNTQAIAVTITDVNEFPVSAISDTNGATNAVNENAGIGTTVGITAFASDVDASNSAITYSLDNSAGGLFAIDAATGVVTVNGSLDYETATSHAIVVRATSADTSFSTANFTITVNPLNDINPVITSNGGGASAAINVAENSTAVTTITATDADLPAQTLTYSIIGGADAAKFAINTNTGVLTFASAPNYETPTDADANNVFDVIVQVDDGALADTQAIAVTVTNVNEAPTATNLGAAQTYTEDSPLALTAIVVGDVDSANITATLTLSNASAGSLNTETSGAVTSTYNAGNGVWTASGAIADVNTLLAGLTFTPSSDFNSNFTIATRISDGSLSVNGAKSMAGTAVNDAPVGRNAAYSVDNNSILNVAAPGLLATASDLDGDVLIAILITGPATGTLRLEANGAVIYTPDPNFAGFVSFSYVISDGTKVSGPLTVTLEVIATAGPPPAGGGSGTAPVRRDDSHDTQHEPAVAPSGIALPAAANIPVPGNDAVSGGWSTREVAANLSRETAAVLARIPNSEPQFVPDTAFFHSTESMPAKFTKTLVGALLPGVAPVVALIDNTQFWRGLDDFQAELRAPEEILKLTAGSVAFASLAVTSGYVLWTLKGGYMLASVMSSLPAWRFVDPLPIFDASLGTAYDRKEEDLPEHEFFP